MRHWPETTDDFAFHVEQWDDRNMHIEEVMMVAKHVMLARAAYTMAVELYPGRNLKLRHGARVIETSRGP